MSTKEWFYSLTQEQKNSFLRLGFGFWPRIMMKIIEEDGLRVGCQSRYNLVTNMVGNP